jgi:hypothetical protein
LGMPPAVVQSVPILLVYVRKNRMKKSHKAAV